MPIAYLDVPQGIRITEKRRMVEEIYDALHAAYPFPNDVRLYIREWPLESVSQNGRLDGEPTKPVLMLHVPQGGTIEAKREMVKAINAAVAEVYSLPKFLIMMQEYPLDRVALDGRLHADNQRRVEEQTKVYGRV